MRASRSRLALASELATAPLMRPRIAASASMKKFTVEPVPTPTIMSSLTYSSAASAAAFFCALASIGEGYAMLPGSMKRDNYLERILTAKVYDVAIESPLEAAPAISRRTGNHILLKREDKQPVFSFKLRGAYNKMAHLKPAELARGVICASAGNHAQGVALAAQKLGTQATIVMPVTTPRIKVTAVSARGAKVELQGDSYHEANLHARALARRHGLTFVHPYDDPLVIAGQGTIGMEIVRQHPRPIDAIFVPVGGGGLIAGIAAYVKRVMPATKIIGVEPVDSNAMQKSLAAGRR